MKISSVSKKVLASALSAAMVVAFAPTVAFAAGVNITPGESTIEAGAGVSSFTTFAAAEAAAKVAGPTCVVVELEGATSGVKVYTVVKDLPTAVKATVDAAYVINKITLVQDYDATLAPVTIGAADVANKKIDLNGYTLAGLTLTGWSATLLGTGTVNGNFANLILGSNASIAVIGGTITAYDASAEGATLTAMGGTWSVDVSNAANKVVVPTGYVVDEIGGKYVVSGGKGAIVKTWDAYGNKVDTEMSLESALNAIANKYDSTPDVFTANAEEGKVVAKAITLTADAKGAYNFTGIDVDGAGHTITGGITATTKVSNLTVAAKASTDVAIAGADVSGTATYATLTNVNVTKGQATAGKIVSGTFADAVYAKEIVDGTFTSKTAVVDTTVLGGTNKVTGGTFAAKADGSLNLTANSLAHNYVAYPTYGTATFGGSTAQAGLLMPETYVVARGLAVESTLPTQIKANSSVWNATTNPTGTQKVGISDVVAASKGIMANIFSTAPDATSIAGLTLPTGTKAKALQDALATAAEIDFTYAAKNIVKGNKADEALEAVVKTAAGEGAAVDGYFTIGAEIGTTDAMINDFGSDVVTVTYTLQKATGTVNEYAVVDESGKVIPATYAAGTISFKASKMGTYGVVYGDRINASEDEANKANEELQKQIAALQDEVAVAKVAGASKTVKLAKGVKKTKKAQTVTLKSVASASGAKVAYKKSSGSKYITVKGAKATLKKGVKKATYTAKVKATIGEATKTVTVKFVVK